MTIGGSGVAAPRLKSLAKLSTRLSVVMALKQALLNGTRGQRKERHKSGAGWGIRPASL